MKYKEHTIKWFESSCCIFDNYINDDTTSIGIIYGPVIHSKIYIYGMGRNRAYKLLKKIVDIKLKEKKDE